VFCPSLRLCLDLFSRRSLDPSEVFCLFFFIECDGEADGICKLTCSYCCSLHCIFARHAFGCWSLPSCYILHALPFCCSKRECRAVRTVLQYRPYNGSNVDRCTVLVSASACTDVRSTVPEFFDPAKTVFRCQLPKPLGLRLPLINQLRGILFNGEGKR